MAETSVGGNIKYPSLGGRAMAQGTVKWFNFSKGYGFIEQEEGDDLFVHKTEVTGTIREGDAVTYEVGESDKGPNAINVAKVE